MSRSRYRIHDDQQPYFLTCTIVEWLPVFTRPETVKIVLDSWRYLQSQRAIVLYGYVILENHLHMIASGNGLSDVLRRFKSFTARKIIDTLRQHAEESVLRLLALFKLEHKADQHYQLWQEGSHPQEIQNREMMIQKLEYIHNNPVNRGYVDDPTRWRYSSARNYHGQAGLIDVQTDW